MSASPFPLELSPSGQAPSSGTAPNCLRSSDVLLLESQLPCSASLFVHQSTSELVVKEVIENIQTRCTDLLRRNHLENLAYPYAAHSVVQLLFTHLAIANVAHDPGESDPAPYHNHKQCDAVNAWPQPSDNSLRNCTLAATTSLTASGITATAPSPQDTFSYDWCCPPTPAPSVIDTWARGAVPMRSRNRDASCVTSSTFRHVGSLTAGSFGSHGTTDKTLDTSQGSRTNPIRGRDRAPGDSRAFSKTRHRPTVKPLPTIATDKTDQSVIKSPRSVRFQPVPLQVAKLIDPEEESIRESKDRELRRKKDDEAKQRLSEQEAALAAQRLENAQTELKSKTYAHDSAGNLLVVTHINTSRLPPSNYVVPFKLRAATADVSNDSPLPTPRPGLQDKRNDQIQKQMDRTRRKRNTGIDSGLLASLCAVDADEQFVKATTVQQPSAIDTLVLSRGVTVKEGERRKQGSFRCGQTR
eukprot:GHVQ01032917.1.p1 GENE.GHVQ01032917.1~~GHVQ01032917.1.p1  ORF type:complete len:470 (-),score=56.99 GHVQ01032917.1:720-2129(-)